MLMMLVDDDSNGLSLPMLMSMQGMNSGTQANPLLWLSLLDDSTLTKTQCDAKYALPYAKVAEVSLHVLFLLVFFLS